MELKELTEMLKKEDETPTDTLIRVLGRYAEEHPEEVNKQLSPEEMAAENSRLKKDLAEKDLLVQRLLKQMNDGGRAQPAQEPAPAPAIQAPVRQVQTVQKVAPQTVSADELMDNGVITNLSSLSEEEIESRMKNQEWAKTNSDMRAQVMKFIEEERRKERQ